jgi:hypothetical protein
MVKSSLASTNGAPRSLTNMNGDVGIPCSGCSRRRARNSRPVTRFVAQVGVIAVCRADEYALSGVDLHVKKVLETSPVVVNA